MTRNQWVTRILNRVGQRGGTVSPVDTVLKTQVEDEFLTQQEELERSELAMMPWFLETEYEDPTFKTTASTKTVALPTGFLREQDEAEVALFYQDTTVSGDTWIPIPKADYDELKDEFGGDVNGKPKGYCIMGTNYRLFPTPDAAYLLRALIYVAAAPLTSDIENTWLKYAGRVLAGKVGQVTATVLVRDDNAIAFFTDMHAQGIAGLERDNVARKEAGRMRQMGVD